MSPCHQNISVLCTYLLVTCSLIVRLPGSLTFSVPPLLPSSMVTVRPMWMTVCHPASCFLTPLLLSTSAIVTHRLCHNNSTSKRPVSPSPRIFPPQ